MTPWVQDYTCCLYLIELGQNLVNITNYDKPIATFKACNSTNVKFLLPLQDFGKVSSRIGEGEGEMNVSATLTSDMVNNVPFLHAP
jgi:hypothetical protein